jgi:hypothetical protein
MRSSSWSALVTGGLVAAGQQQGVEVPLAILKACGIELFFDDDTNVARA